MIGRVHPVQFVSCLSLLFHFGSAIAQEAEQPSQVQIEPVDFIDNARPPQPADPMNRRTASLTPTGWGFAAFSADGKYVATVSVPEAKEANGEVTIWDVADSKNAVRFEQTSRIATVAFSPDGKWLAIGPYAPHSGVKLVDTKTGQVAQTLPGPVARTNAMTWSPDGRQLALASTTDRTVRVWNVEDKKFLKAYEPEASKLLGLGFTPDGTILAAGAPLANNDGLAVFDLASPEKTQTLKGHKELIEMAAFTSDASVLVSGGWDATLRVWDLKTGAESGVMKGHKKGIRSVSISGAGKRLVSSNEREFDLWDGEKKELLGELAVDNVGAKFVTISPDGAWIVSISRDGIAHLWDVETKTEKAKLERNAGSMTMAGNSDDSASGRTANPAGSDSPEPEAIQSLAYSRDGKWIALAREDGRISIRNAEEGTVARELEAFSDVAACVAFSLDSRRIAAGSFDKSIKVWDVATGELQADLKGHTNWVFSVAFSADGSTLASGSYDKTIKLWNISDSREIATLTGHTAGVRSVCFTIDGQNLISGSADRTAIVWSLADHKVVATLKGHAAAVRAVACSPDGTLVATASEDATVKLWKTDGWTEKTPPLQGTEGVMFWCLAFSPAGRTLAAGAFNGTVKLYDPTDGKERKTLQGPTEAITAVAFAPGAREIVAGSIDKSLRRWKAETGSAAVAAAKRGDNEKAPELKPAEAVTALNAVVLNVQHSVLALAYSRDGHWLAVGTGNYKAPGSLQLWDLAKRERLWQSQEFRSGLPGIAFSTDDKQIAAGNFADNFVRLFDVSSGKQLKEIRGHRRRVCGIAYSPTGKYFATSAMDNEIKLWDVTTNREVKTFAGHEDTVYSIVFSHDGRRLLSGSYDKTARIWDVETGHEVMQLKGHQAGIQQAIYSSDGSEIATASTDKTVRIYDSATGDYLLTLRGHSHKVESVAFAPQGKLIATGSSDRTIRLWDSSSGNELLKMTQEAIVRAVVFSPDGKYLASGCDDKTVKLWEMAGFAINETAITAAKTP